MPKPAHAVLGHLRRRRLVGASMVALGPKVATAQSPWPDRPVRLLTVLPAGSAADVVLRGIAPDLLAHFGRPFVLEPRPGGGGTIAALAVAQSTDGHTLGVMQGGPTTTARALNPALAYDPARAFSPVCLVFLTGFVFAIAPGLPATDFAGLIAYARAHPGRLSYGSIGPGTVTHLAMEEFKARHGLDIEHVSYRGFGPMALDLAAGRIHCGLSTYVTALPFVQDGRLRALAVTGGTRVPAYPDVPTVAEAGEPAAECFGWTGIVAPAGFPADRASAIAEVIRAALSRPANRAGLEAQGLEFVASTPEDFAAFQAREAARWIAVIDRLGLRVSD